MKKVTAIYDKDFKGFITNGKKYDVVEIKGSTIFIICDTGIVLGLDKMRFRM